MSNIIDFGDSQQQEDAMPTYELSYINPASGEILSSIFTGDAVMTATFVGIVTEDQILQFAVNMDNLLTIRQVDPASAAVN